MPEAGTDSALATFTAPQCPFVIQYAPRVLDDVRLAVVDAFFSLPRGGAEIGGLLLGKMENGRLMILDYAALDCEHAFGPSFTLSPRDQAQMAELLFVARRNPPDRQPVGWYHSHTRSEILFSDADQEIHNRFFTESWQIALVLRPHTFQPTRAGFFFRERDGSIHGAATYQEFVLEPLPLRPVPSGGFGPLPAAPPAARREPEPRGLVIDIGADRVPDAPPAGPVAPSQPRAATAFPSPPPASAPSAPPVDTAFVAPPPPPSPPTRREPEPRVPVFDMAAARAPAAPAPPPAPPPPVATAFAAAPEPVPAAPPLPVRKTSEPELAMAAISGPHMIDLPAPKFLSTQPQRSWLWLKILVALAIGGSIGAAAYENQGLWLPRVMAVIHPAAPPAPVSVGLNTLDTDGQLQIRWDRNSPEVRKGLDGILSINDGPTPQAILLDAAHLQAGVFTYARQSEKVDVKLTVRQPAGQPVSEVTIFLGKLPERKAMPEDPELRQQRDDAIAQASKLKQDLAAQVWRTKKAEKALQDMTRAAVNQQRRRLENQNADTIKQ